jgi:hypothetical protein
MNERIQELFKRAGGKTSSRNLASNPIQVVETHELWDDRIEKFAELIVRECTNIVLHYTDVDEGVAVAKKHFGIEE